MKKKFVCIVCFLTTGAISWLLLSYFFFPIKLSAAPLEYFAETMTHMMAFKFIITLVFCLGASFIADIKMEKRIKMQNNDMKTD